MVEPEPEPESRDKMSFVETLKCNVGQFLVSLMLAALLGWAALDSHRQDQRLAQIISANRATSRDRDAQGEMDRDELRRAIYVTGEAVERLDEELKDRRRAISYISGMLEQVRADVSRLLRKDEKPEPEPEP